MTNPAAQLAILKHVTRQESRTTGDSTPPALAQASQPRGRAQLGGDVTEPGLQSGEGEWGVEGAPPDSPAGGPVSVTLR